MAKAERDAGGRLPGAAAAPTAALFTFGTEDRIQCGETGRVRGWTGRASGAGTGLGAGGEGWQAARDSRAKGSNLAMHCGCTRPWPCPRAAAQVAYKQEVGTTLGLRIPEEAAENRAELEAYQVGGWRQSPVCSRASGCPACNPHLSDLCLATPRRSGSRSGRSSKRRAGRMPPWARRVCAASVRLLTWQSLVPRGCHLAHAHALPPVVPAPLQEEEEERVVPRVPFSACLASWSADSVVEDYRSAAAGKNVQVWCGRPAWRPSHRGPAAAAAAGAVTCCSPVALPFVPPVNTPRKLLTCMRPCPPPAHAPCHAGHQAHAVCLLPALPAAPDAAVLCQRQLAAQEAGRERGAVVGWGVWLCAGTGWAHRRSWCCITQGGDAASGFPNRLCTLLLPPFPLRRWWWRCHRSWTWRCCGAAACRCAPWGRATAPRSGTQPALILI